MAKEKITFSARKDPLLRPQPASQHRKPASGQRRPAPAVPDASTPVDSAPVISQPTRRRTSASNGRRRSALAAVEEPAGAISVPALATDPAQEGSGGPPDGPSRPAPGPRSDRCRQGARRAQTSMSLPPASWDMLDELSHATGASTGELLVAILGQAIPDSPTVALDVIEQLLVNAPDETLREERNYRLPLDLRAQLDALTKALGPSVQRSLLVRALLAAHSPQGAADARTLITARRIAVMRASATS